VADDDLDDGVAIDVVDPRSAAAREALTQYLAEIVRRGAVRSVATGELDDVDDYTPPGGRFLVVSRRDAVLGCGAVRSMTRVTGEVKRMWIHPDARGAGLGSRLLDALVAQSRALGHTTLLLDTNAVLTEARALYAKHGFEAIGPYNDNPDATHFFCKTL
jgi:GNAT superfamily N-acetyltransferase